MPLYQGVAVENAQDVDSITKARIRVVVGDYDEEAKWHRLALFAIVVQGYPHMATPEELVRAKRIAEQVRGIYLTIEGIIEDGRRFKTENGYI